GRKDCRLPVRADHGIAILDDLKRKTNPGYPLAGRFKGLMEIKGIENDILYLLNCNKN
ncbi:MAG: mannonate dehydratase, partial [bacterium]